jgi:hypothetical protein
MIPKLPPNYYPFSVPLIMKFTLTSSVVGRFDEALKHRPSFDSFPTNFGPLCSGGEFHDQGENVKKENYYLIVFQATKYVFRAANPLSGVGRSNPSTPH